MPEKSGTVAGAVRPHPGIAAAANTPANRSLRPNPVMDPPLLPFSPIYALSASGGYGRDTAPTANFAKNARQNAILSAPPPPCGEVDPAKRVARSRIGWGAEQKAKTTSRMIARRLNRSPH